MKYNKYFLIALVLILLFYILNQNSYNATISEPSLENSSQNKSEITINETDTGLLKSKTDKTSIDSKVKSKQFKNISIPINSLNHIEDILDYLENHQIDNFHAIYSKLPILSPLSYKPIISGLFKGDVYTLTNFNEDKIEPKGKIELEFQFEQNQISDPIDKRFSGKMKLEIMFPNIYNDSDQFHGWIANVDEILPIKKYNNSTAMLSDFGVGEDGKLYQIFQISEDRIAGNYYGILRGKSKRFGWFVANKVRD